jgi:hypothetical protein
MRMIGLKRMPGRVRVTSDEGDFDVVFSSPTPGHRAGDPFVELLPGSSIDKQAAEELMFELMRDGRLRQP